MKNATMRVDRYRLAVLTALTVSVLLILSSIYLSDDASAFYKARFKCDGRIHTACNEHTGESISKDPDPSDPANWCHTFQIDDNNPPEWSYRMIYIGDHGKKCTLYGGKPDKCNPDDLDWDCSRPPKPAEPNKPPACDGLYVTPSTVSSLTQPITIFVKASDPDGVVSSIRVRAATAKQGPPQPSFHCVASPTTASNYSYYCQGTDVFALVGYNENSNTLRYTTTYKDLMNKIKELGVKKDIEKTGIYLTVNVQNDKDGNICSSNIARNSGNGVLWNNGKWDQACDGGCNINLFYKPPVKPQEPVSCDGACSDTNDCEGDLVCSNGKCRNYSCTAETDCTCPAKPAEPRCGDNVCNQDSEMCENGVSCSSGAAVSCRTDCTYCGDGVKNGDEQCDWAESGVTNCTAQCTTVHKPVDTAGFGGWIDENIALLVGFGMLFGGAGVMLGAVVLKRKVRVVY